jgi:subtilisin family serine protease
MKNIHLIMTTLVLVSCLLMSSQIQATGQSVNEWDEWDVIPGTVLIKYTESKARLLKNNKLGSGIKGLNVKHIEGSVREQLAKPTVGIDFVELLPNTFVGTFDPGERHRVLEELSSDSDVEYFEPDRIRIPDRCWSTPTPNDPYLPLWGMTRIGAPFGWARQSSNRSGVRVAVMEDQIDFSHGDLARQKSPVQRPKYGNQGDHATYVAGIVCATGNNGFGVAGVANVELVSLGVPGRSSEFAEAISWALNNGVRVINMSWHWCVTDKHGHCIDCRYAEPERTEQEAITHASSRIAFVAAAGNCSHQIDSYGRIPYPASYDGVLGTSALDFRDNLASFSNFGMYVDIVAPGDGIWSTWPQNQIVNASGTSASAPHVAGAAAVIAAIRPDFSMPSVRRLLLLTAEDLGPGGWDPLFGHGVVRVDRALEGIADVYAENLLIWPLPFGPGTLTWPCRTVKRAVEKAPSGGTIGLVGKSAFRETIVITKPCKIISVGGKATIGR